MKILVAPLDWGLGHATRCIPLIMELLREGVEVVVGGTESTNALLRAEFPQLTYYVLPGYAVSYSKRKWMLPFKLLLQLPGVWRAVQAEHRWLQQAIQDWQIDAVVSDNRYGLYTSQVPCIFMTHQLQIQVPRVPFLQRLVNRLNHRFIRRFTACWVPDDPALWMAGDLSVSKGLPKLSYIGNLSRFSRQRGDQRKTAAIPVYHTVFLLSGPEPQRSLLEEQLTAICRHWPHKVLLVRGLPRLSAEPECLHAGADRVAHLPAAKLEQVLSNASCIICRSGYSTVMDLMKLGKTALLVPTPGQTEQEYLAVYLQEKGWFTTVPQSALTPEAALAFVQRPPAVSFPPFNEQLLQQTVHIFLQQLTKE